MREGPWLSAGLTAIAVGLAFVPGAFEALVLDADGLARGELWRLLTGHFVHWSTAHRVWDAGVFFALAAVCERQGRLRLLAGVGLAGLGVSLGVLALQPELDRYAGLSGIVCSLSAWLVLDWMAAQWRLGRRRGVWLGMAGAGAFALKLGFEWATGTALFAGELAPGVVPVPLAHLLGAGLGLLLGAGLGLLPGAGLGPLPGAGLGPLPGAPLGPARETPS
ncbi:MAG: rhombosortase [Myxococcota bacterium]